MKIELKFWWNPQIGRCKTFELPIASVKEGRILEAAFAKYDLFQLENNIKPDYANTGGISMRHPILTEGEWWDVADDEEELFDLIAEAKMRNIDSTPLEN